MCISCSCSSISRGNTSKLDVQKRHRVSEISSLSAIEVEKIQSKKILNKMDSFNELQKLRQCGCATSRLDPNGNVLGCALSIFATPIEKHSGVFDIDFEKASSRFLYYRDLTRSKSSIELDHFMQEKFRQCITRRIVNEKSGSIKFEMRYSIDDVKVCKVAFASFYGVSVDYLEKISRSIKNSSDLRVYSSNIRSFKDSTIHDYTFAQAESVFRENLSEECGQCYHSIIASLISLYLFQTKRWSEQHLLLFQIASTIA